MVLKMVFLSVDNEFSSFGTLCAWLVSSVPLGNTIRTPNSTVPS